MANKYRSLVQWLSEPHPDPLRVGFDQLDDVIGGLPPSAKRDRTWWGNTPGNSQSAAWLEAGWLVEAVDLKAAHVIFVRGVHRPRSDAGLRPARSGASRTSTARAGCQTDGRGSDMTTVHDVILGRLLAMFSGPVMQNSLRSMYVEEQVGVLLGSRWRSVGADWAGWDFESLDGVRLEVKQSAAKQSWSQSRASRGSFDIAPRTGRYDGAVWVPGEGRAADIYLLAWHGRADEHCDQRDEAQWEYYLVAARSLPARQKTIALSRVQQLANPVAATEVAAQAERLAADLPAGRS